jgi:hypothetical protein
MDETNLELMRNKEENNQDVRDALFFLRAKVRGLRIQTMVVEDEINTLQKTIENNED